MADLETKQPGSPRVAADAPADEDDGDFQTRPAPRAGGGGGGGDGGDAAMADGASGLAARPDDDDDEGQPDLSTYVALRAEKRPRAVLPTGSAIHQIAPIVKPTSQQGSVILNAQAVLDLHAVRLRECEKAEPDYPMLSHKHAGYNVQQNEMVFRTVPIGLDGQTRSNGSRPEVWSSWNGFASSCHKAVCIGVADLPTRLSPGEGSSPNGKFSCAMSGSRTLIAGPEAMVHLGDHLMWAMPYAASDAKGNILPGMPMKGVPIGKFVAHVTPMKLTEFGSPLNVYRNWVSHFAGGGFEPQKNDGFTEMLEIQAISEKYLNDEDAGQKKAGENPLQTLIADLARVVTPTQPPSHFMTVFESYRRHAERSVDVTGGGSGTKRRAVAVADTKANARVAVGKAIIRLINTYLIRAMQKQIDFALDRNVGRAMSSGLAGPVDTFFRV